MKQLKILITGVLLCVSLCVFAQEKNSIPPPPPEPPALPPPPPLPPKHLKVNKPTAISGKAALPKASVAVEISEPPVPPPPPPPEVKEPM